MKELGAKTKEYGSRARTKAEQIIDDAHVAMLIRTPATKSLLAKNNY